MFMFCLVVVLTVYDCMCHFLSSDSVQYYNNNNNNNEYNNYCNYNYNVLTVYIHKCS